MKVVALECTRDGFVADACHLNASAAAFLDYIVVVEKDWLSCIG